MSSGSERRNSATGKLPIVSWEHETGNVGAMEGHRGAVLACQTASVSIARRADMIIRRNGGAMTIETGTKKGTDNVSEDQPEDFWRAFGECGGGDTESRSALPEARSTEHLTCAGILQMHESQLGLTHWTCQPLEEMPSI
jgi:hypothetical protein